MLPTAAPTWYIPSGHSATDCPTLQELGPPTTTGTLADQFIGELKQVANFTADWPAEQPLHPQLNQALIAMADLTCDMLYDAELTRTVLDRLGSQPTTERINIAFSDGSQVTAMAAWLEDQIELFSQRITGHHWNALRGQSLCFHPWGDSGLRVFQNLSAGHNAAPQELSYPDEYPTRALLGFD